VVGRSRDCGGGRDISDCRIWISGRERRETALGTWIARPLIVFSSIQNFAWPATFHGFIRRLGS
jgi:hypothetical protein